MKTVGYWYSKDFPTLPMPLGAPRPWKGEEEFLAALQVVETICRTDHYKGSSTCRICGCSNGSEECRTDQFRWPTGLRHYVEKHHIGLPEDFVKYVLAKAK